MKNIRILESDLNFCPFCAIVIVIKIAPVTASDKWVYEEQEGVIKMINVWIDQAEICYAWTNDRAHGRPNKGIRQPWPAWPGAVPTLFYNQGKLVKLNFMFYEKQDNYSHEQCIWGSKMSIKHRIYTKLLFFGLFEVCPYPTNYFLMISNCFLLLIALKRRYR